MVLPHNKALYKSPAYSYFAWLTSYDSFWQTMKTIRLIELLNWIAQYVGANEFGLWWSIGLLHLRWTVETVTWNLQTLFLLSYVQTLAEDIFIWADYAFSALETILNCLMDYISVLSNSNSNSNSCRLRRKEMECGLLHKLRQATHILLHLATTSNWNVISAGRSCDTLIQTSPAQVSALGPN